METFVSMFWIIIWSFALSMLPLLYKFLIWLGE